MPSVDDFALSPKGNEDEERDERIGEKPTSRKVTRDSSFAERRVKAEALLHQNPKIRWTMYHVLERCSDGAAHPLAELEDFVAAQPGFEGTKIAPYFAVKWLEEAFALEELYLDADGKVFTADDVAPLSEDEFDDLVAQFAYRSTDVGEAILEQFAPRTALLDLFEEEGEIHKRIYLKILEFTREPRNFAEIDHLIRPSSAYIDALNENANLSPVYFLDKLAFVGGIVFEGRWKTTREGEKLLEEEKAEK